MVWHTNCGRPRRALYGLLIGALALKALLLFGILPVVEQKFSSYYGITFADDYDKLANSLVAGQGYRLAPDLPETMMREPGYPLFLAGAFRMFGSTLYVARIANFVLTLLICFAIFRIARFYSDDPNVPLVATLIFLFHPGVVIAEARGGVEILFIFFLVAFFAVLLKAIEKGTLRAYLVAGAVLGLLSLVRSTLLLFPFLLLAYFFIVARSMKERRTAIVNIAVLSCAAFVVLLPWMVRNYSLVNQFVPTATVQGVAAQSGQYICKNMGLDKRLQDVDYQASEARNELAKRWGYQFRASYYQYFYSTADEASFNKQLMAAVLGEYRESPMLYLRCTTSNLFNFWFAGKSWTSTLLNMGVQLPLLISAAVGFILLRKNARDDTARKQVGVIWLLIFYLWGMHALIHAQARYSIPLVAVLAIISSVALVYMWRHWAIFVWGKRVRNDSPGMQKRGA